jgi:regulator of protease activity HflC (stomatin/prohibitin superfamily)
MEILVLIAALALFVIVMGVTGLKIVHQAEVMVIERLGKYHRTLSPGVNIIWPMLDRARQILWRVRITDVSGKDRVLTQNRTTIDMREQVFDFPRQSVITSDNVVIEINGLLYYQVTDPKRAAYEVANLPNAIEMLAQTTLRNIIGEMALDETLTSRDQINGKMRNVLDEATDKWGVKVNRVELQDIAPPPQVQEAMELQMRAERERRATILEAEGVKQSQILRAEGQRDATIAEAEGERRARILRAEGEARSLEVVTGALGEQEVDSAQYLIAMRYLSTLAAVGESREGSKTVFLPYEGTGLLSSLGSIREMFKETS